MRHLFLLLCLLGWSKSYTQVYNFGANEITFKNMIENGITYVKTGNTHFDSIMIAELETQWKLTDFSVIDQYKRPAKTSTAFFITTKELTRKYMMDRKNQHVLVLQPGKIYVPRKSVTMEQTLGYMYLNGFYDLVSEEDEHRFVYVLVKTLHDGLSAIKNKHLTGEPEKLNEKVAAEIMGTDPPSAGNILILNREQTRHAIVPEELDKLDITYRLLGEEEYYSTLSKKNPKHVMLYFSVNRFTEVALVRISDGEMLFCGHFREGYETLEKKELKAFAPFFQ